MRNKLRLEADDLQVETFEAGDLTVEPGTVYAAENTMEFPECSTMDRSCEGNWTCREGCNTFWTCSIEYTCASHAE